VHFKEIGDVISQSKGSFALWLLGNVGGLLIVYLAGFTIWIYHGRWGAFLPGPEIFLIMGTISLAVTGVSYIRLHSDDPTISLSPWLSLTWPFPVMAAYGVLVAMGIKPIIRSNCTAYTIAILIAFFCLTWASLTWAHERGIKDEMRGEPQPPQPPRLESDNLPRFAFDEMTPEEEVKKNDQ